MRPAMLNGIGSLRAISCLLIASYHVTRHLEVNSREVWFPFAQTPGIHIFLVISGFVLARTALADDTPIRFIFRRLGRIVPLYWLMTAFAIVLLSWHSWLLPAADLSFFSIVSSFLFLPQQDLSGLIQPILFVGWTLNYIVLNNMLFAVATFAPVRMRPFITAIQLLAFMALAHLLPEGAMRTFWTNWIQLDFMAGLAVGALLLDPRIGAWVRKHSMWPIVTVAGLVLTAGTLSDLAGLPRIAVCGLSAAVVVFGLAGQDIYRKALGDGPLPWLGRISYSLYLIHPLVVPVVGAVVISHLGQAWIEIVVVIGATFGLTIAAAYICNRFVEQPANAWVRRHAVAPLQSNRSALNTPFST